MNFFVRYFVEMQLPIGMVEPALDELPSDWLVAMARNAHARALGLVLESDADLGDDLAGTLVEVSTESGTSNGSTWIHPIAWALIGPHSAMPLLEADLEVGPLGGSSTQLALSGRYFIPSMHGHPRLDRSTGQRIGESAVKEFVDGLADAVKRLALGVHALPPPLAHVPGWSEKRGWPLKVV
jgi:hypothetical protein